MQTKHTDSNTGLYTMFFFVFSVSIGLASQSRFVFLPHSLKDLAHILA